MKVLLVQPPFWAVNSPSIGLSYLRGALRDSGAEADILYSNLDFAKLIGREVYGLIQSQLPVDLLFGDLVFGPALQETPVRPGRMREFLETLLASRTIALSVPEALLGQCDSLAEAALNFVGAFQASMAWQGYDLVGFTTTFSLVPALAMAKAMKQDPAAPPIVFGGCHCDGSLGEAMLRHFPWIDFAARGDGEKLVVSLVEHLRVPFALAGVLWMLFLSQCSWTGSSGWRR